MMIKKICLSAFIGSFCMSAANASVTLIAKGSINAPADLADNTANTLENGVVGNMLGGIGSGLAYVGNNTFLAIPDRGPNAVAYNSGLSDTTSYINRFQTLHLALTPSSGPLPFSLTPTLTKTTLLSASTPLTYGSGIGFGVGSGAPSLNSRHTYYFTGRADNFDSNQNSLNSNNGRFDPESIRTAARGRFVYISDEYGPYIYNFRTGSGKRLEVITLPEKFAATYLNANGDAEISGNTVGRVANKGMEGLAITPDGSSLIGIMQSPLAQDGGTSAPYVRIVKINIKTNAVNEYAYPLDNIGTVSKPKYPTISEMVAINNNEFLVDERDGKGLGDNSTAVVKKIYRIDLTNAQEVGSIIGAANLAPKAVTKTLFLDIVAALNANGVASNDIPAKIEGMAFGPDVVINNTTKHTLYVASDNDFISTVTDSNHPSGIANPNQFFVFAIDHADLPNYIQTY